MSSDALPHEPAPGIAELAVTLFDPGPAVEPPPPLSADRRRTLRQQATLAAGHHPATGVLLAGNGETCRTCAHAVGRRYAKTYWKCDRVRDSHCAATDIRLSWPACALWEAEK
jgi:hypothetical protein